MYSEKTGLHRRQREHRPGQLRTVAIDVTNRCNLTCPHCYAAPFRDKPEMPIDRLCRAIGELRELGAYHLVLQGGEAVMAPDRLEAVIAASIPEETYINVVSNGSLMTRERIRWLKSLQVDKICFSLDSGFEEEHDRNRMPGAYRKVLEAIDTTVEEGLLAAVSTVIRTGTLASESFRRLYAYATAKKVRLDLQMAMPVGRWHGLTEYMITPEDAAAIKTLYEQSPILPNGQRLINRDIFNFGGRDHCPAGNKFLAITAGGDILPCNFVQFSIGRVGEVSIREAREALIGNPWFDGNQPRCLTGENLDFVHRFIAPLPANAFPQDAYAAFGLKRPQP